MQGKPLALVTVLLLVSLAGTARTQEGEREEVGRDGQVEKEKAGEGEVDEAKERVRVLLRHLGLGLAARDDLIAGLQGQMPGRPDSFWDGFVTDDDIREFEDLLIPSYQKRYTPEEIEEWIAFCETPLGRKIAKEARAIHGERSVNTMTWGMKIWMKVMDRMKEEMEEGAEGEPGEEASEDPHGTLEEARREGNEVAAIAALVTIARAQARFRAEDREGDQAFDYATNLAELSSVGLIDNLLATGKKAGYLFTLSGTTYDWKASATPESEKTGTRNFIVCTDGVVRFATKGPADCGSEAIE